MAAGSRCRTTRASSPPPGPAFHHHTWETNTLQLNPQDSIQGMLPESAWPRAWLSVLGACHTLEGLRAAARGQNEF